MPTDQLLAELHQVLGDMNDDKVCQRLARRLAPGGGVIEATAGQQRRFCGLWAKFQTTAPPWGSPLDLPPSVINPCSRGESFESVPTVDPELPCAGEFDDA